MLRRRALLDKRTAIYDAEIEYIEQSTGYEYINTGFYPTNKTSIYEEVEMVTSSSVDVEDWIEAYTGVWADRAYGFIYNKYDQLWLFGGSKYETATSGQLSFGIKYTIEIRSTTSNLSLYVNKLVSGSYFIVKNSFWPVNFAISLLVSPQTFLLRVSTTLM